MKRVAVLGIKTYPAFTGPDRVSENIIDHIDDEYAYSIYLMNDVEDKLAPIGNKEFIYLPSFPGKHLKAFSYYFFAMLHALFTRRKYDVLHLHNSDVGLYMILLSLRYRDRMVGTFHGNPYERSKWGGFAKWYLQTSEKYFVKHSAALTSVTATKTLPNQQIIYIPNGIEKIDVRSFSSYQNVNINYDTLSIPRQHFILFACGRLDRTKGLHHLLAAYKMVDTDVPVVVVGNFTHDKDYSAFIDSEADAINKANSQNRVIVIKDLLPKQDLFDLITKSKFVVFPSEIEAMSMFLLEVLACNKAVICSDIEENMAVVGKNYDLTFKSKDERSLYQQLIKLLNTPVGTSIEKSVDLSEFDWNNIAQAYKDTYTQVMNRPQ